jgi:hypothetical protein
MANLRHCIIKRLDILVISLFVAAFTQAAGAKAYFAGKKEMISRSEAIAVVKITKVEKADAKGNVWTYRQRATGEVKQTLKGKLPKEISLYGQETFICAQCQFAEGEFLLFLRQDGDKWVGANWHLSIRPITDKDVEWYVDDKSINQKKAPLDDVLKEVRDIVQTQRQEEGEKNGKPPVN